MIKEALKYLVNLGEAKLLTVDNKTYSDKPLNKVSYIPYADSIKMNTLTSLVDYIKAEVDTLSDKMIVHVVSPECVELYSKLDSERNRENIIKVTASVPSFEFGRFIEQEVFCIALQSKFIENDDRTLVLKFAGTVEDGTVAQYGDDGITQKATVKTGIASKSDAVVPNPVKLKPYRTFTEVDQPESEFVFRMRSGSDRGAQGVYCAIFEADGGAWKNAATANIKDFLQKELSDYPGFIIIA
jgi:hypothetical protein